MSVKIKGVDISYCQDGLNYAALRGAGVKFAIIRAGYTGGEDRLLTTHVKGCVDNNIAYGYYWYCYSESVEGAKADAEACLKTIRQFGRPSYPVFFDMEEKSQIKNLDSKTRTDMALAFCEAIEEGGYPAGIYANPSWLESYYEKERLVGQYDIWLAHWTNSPDVPSSYDYGQTMWQWGLDNIGMDIDGDLSFVNYPAKTSFWYDTHTKPEPAEPSKPDEPEVKELHAGDEVVLKSAPLYGASTSDKVANTLSGTYWIHSDGVVNGRIRITTPKGCAACTGWVNVSDCQTEKTVTVPSSPTNTLRAGDEVVLKNAPLYGASTSTEKVNTLSGVYYIHSDGIINERIRITNPKGCTVCTGWVNVSDCGVKSSPSKEIVNLDDIAYAVIRGEYGNGEERKAKLKAAGYDYDTVQQRVEELYS